MSLYLPRAAHISWERRLASPDSVRVQVWRVPQDVEENHYDVRLVDQTEPAQAVWDVLTDACGFSWEGLAARPAAAAVGAETTPIAPQEVVPGLISERPGRQGPGFV